MTHSEETTSSPLETTQGQRTRRRVWVVLSIVALLVLCLIFLAPRVLPLPFPCGPNGRVVDALSGAPIAGASLEYSWQVYDYPMIDGAGSRTVNATVTTDASGLFRLTRPAVRRGLFKTEASPPIVRASGYVPFTLSDWYNSSIRVENGLLIVPMKPVDGAGK